MTQVPIVLTGPAALRVGWQFLKDPIEAMRRNFAEFGSFVVVSEALPFTKGAKLAMLGLPLVLTVGPQFNEEVLSNPSVWRPVGLFPGGARNSAARRLGAGLARMSGPRHAHFRHLLLPP